MSRSNNDSDEKIGRPAHCYQSVWMAHWTQTSFNAAPETGGRLSDPFCNKRKDYVTNQCQLTTEVGSNILTSGGEFGDTKTRRFGIMNQHLTVSSANIRDEHVGAKTFSDSSHQIGHINPPASCYGHDIVDAQGDNPQTELNLNCHLAIPHKGSQLHSALKPASALDQTSPQKCHSQPAGQVKIHSFFRGSSFEGSRSSQKNFSASESHIVPGKFNPGNSSDEKGKTSKPSFLSKLEQLPDTELRISEHENHVGHSLSTDSEGNIKDHARSHNIMIPYLRQNKMSHLLCDPSSSNQHLPVYAGERERTQPLKFSSQRSPADVTKSNKGHYGCCPQESQHSFHDVEEMQIFTRNSFKKLHGSSPRFSQTIQSLFVSKETECHFLRENKSSRVSRLPDELERKTFNDPPSITPLVRKDRPGVKIQSLGSSTDSEGEKNNGYANNSEAVMKNESSAETDTMDMAPLEAKNQLPGNASSLIGSSRGKTAHAFFNSKLPDINIPLPLAGNSIDNAEASTSRTQTLDMGLLLKRAEQPSKSKSNLCSDGSRIQPEPSSRWVKRLKLGASESHAVGTKSLSLDENASHAKINSYFSKIIKGGITISEPKQGKRLGKELMNLEETTIFERNVESPSSDTSRKGRELLLSHAWINRWCRDRVTTPQKPNTVVLCEPQSSKLALEDLPRKQFPSIAAMALMGKAMSGFQPCDLQKRGSFVVWNTKAF